MKTHYFIKTLTLCIIALASFSASAAIDVTFSDGGTSLTTLTENETATIIVNYGAGDPTTGFLIVASKDAWGTNWVQKEFSLPASATATSVNVEFTPRAYNASDADANRSRVYVGATADAAWGAKISNGIFFDIVEGTPVGVSHDITYHNMTGIGNDDNPATYVEGETVTLANPTGTSAGFAFDGWYEDASFVTAVSTPAVDALATTDQNFYAKWIAATSYNITYVNVIPAEHSNASTYTNDAAVSLTDATRTGYTFSGWYTDVALTMAASDPEIAAWETGNKTFYAKWVLAMDGDGSEGDPFQISSSAHLVQFATYANNTTDHYVLTDDINMDGVTYNHPTNTFTGVFDGAGYEIKNLTITSTVDNTGLIGVLAGPWTDTETAAGGKIKNLELSNVNVSSTAINTGAFVGMISAENCRITNCNIRGGSITGGNNTGGIVGKINNGQFNRVHNCYVDATVDGSAAGGIVGYTRDNVTSIPDSCAFYGTTAGGANQGPMVAYFGDPATYGAMDLSGNYYKSGTNVLGQARLTADGGNVAIQAIAVDQVDLTTQANFGGLDFVNIWRMGPAYPVLMSNMDYPTEVKQLTSTLRVYPNPSNDRVYVNSNNVVSFKLFSLTGKLVQTSFGQNSMDVSTLNNGMYILSIEADGSKYTTKILKK